MSPRIINALSCIGYISAVVVISIVVGLLGATIGLAGLVIIIIALMVYTYKTNPIPQPVLDQDDQPSHYLDRHSGTIEVPPTGEMLSISRRSLQTLLDIAILADKELLMGSCVDGRLLPIDHETNTEYCAECWAMEEAATALSNEETPDVG